MRRVLLLLGACLVMSLVFAQGAMAQQNLADIRANAAETIPLPADGTCPEGFVTVNAPLCAEESPNTPGRIFGYGEGDLALIEQEAAPAANIADDTDTSAAQYGGDDEMTELPDTSGPPLGGIAAGLGVALVTGGLLLRRRLN